MGWDETRTIISFTRARGAVSAENRLCRALTGKRIPPFPSWERGFFVGEKWGRLGALNTAQVLHTVS